MKRYQVRITKQYLVVVEAESEEHACEAAGYKLDNDPKGYVVGIKEYAEEVE